MSEAACEIRFLCRIRKFSSAGENNGHVTRCVGVLGGVWVYCEWCGQRIVLGYPPVTLAVARSSCRLLHILLLSSTGSALSSLLPFCSYSPWLGLRVPPSVSRINKYRYIREYNKIIEFEL